MKKTESLLEIKDLKIKFSDLGNGHIYAVNGISLNVKKGEVLGIVGESGSGKSQTMLSLMGLLSNNASASGEAWFDNKNLISLPTPELNKLRGNKIAMIFQDPMTSLNPYLKVSTQLIEVLDINSPEMSKQQKKDEVLKIMNLVGIPDAEHRLNSYPHEMSGGMRQRIMIAMALLGKPDLLVADEPTTALDVTIQGQILALLKNLKETLNLSVIFVTHDLGIVAQLCNRVAIFYGGKVVEVGDVKTIFKNAKHPYTQALLHSLPQCHKGSQEPLAVIPGYPQLWHKEPELCVFKERCSQIIPKCEHKTPNLSNIEPLTDIPHQVACLLQEENS